MCTQPLNIENKTSIPDYGTKVSFEVPCCKCKQCIDAKVRGYLLRNFLEYKFVSEKSGYAYFDTLTYNNECLPKTDGQPHFDSVHIRNFLKRLRIKIARRYGITGDAFKFWLVCEYGGERFRPHYHILFYVYANIPLLEFKRLINASWWYGFTDSYYMTKKHILSSCAAIRYLTKYLSKYSDFEAWKIEYLQRHPDSSIKDWSKEQLRRFRPFIRQSINLGYNDSIDLLRCDFVLIPSKTDVDLFCYTDYFKRKQFYERIPLYKTEDGTVIYRTTDKGSFVYRLSQKGIEYKKQHFDNNLKSKTAKFFELYSAAPADYKKDIDFLLNGRSFQDLALFDFCFAFRLFDLTYLHLNYDVKISWFDFAKSVYMDSLQLNGRPLQSNFFIQCYNDSEFPETYHMYLILEKFKYIRNNLNYLKDLKLKELDEANKRLELLKRPIQVDNYSFKTVNNYGSFPSI